MGASEQIASLLRAAAADLRSDLDRMQRIDELRAERDECMCAAQEHELLVVEGAPDIALHRVIARQLRDRALRADLQITALISQAAHQAKTPFQYWSRAQRSQQACGYPSPFRSVDTAYCLDAPDHIPAGSCEYDEDPETFVRRGA